MDPMQRLTLEASYRAFEKGKSTSAHSAFEEVVVGSWAVILLSLPLLFQSFRWFCHLCWWNLANCDSQPGSQPKA